jgi:chitin synthase
MWIVLLFTLNFPELSDYGFDSRGFQLLFLGVYGLIIVVQFITLIFHRVVTLIHYLGRIQPDEVMRNPNESIEVVRTYEVLSDNAKNA